MQPEKALNDLPESRPVGSLPASQPAAPSGDDGRPMSEVIRARIQASGQRFHANDNIAAFIHSDAERDALQDEVAQKMEALLQSLVIDTTSDHNTQDTARRVARMYLNEVFAGPSSHCPSSPG